MLWHRLRKSSKNAFRFNLLGKSSQSSINKYFGPKWFFKSAVASFTTESSPLIKWALLVKVCIVHWQRGFVTWASGSMSSCSRCFCPRQSATSFTCSQATPPAVSGPKFQEGHSDPNHNNSLGHRHVHSLGSSKQLSVFTQVLHHYYSSGINITLFV